MKYSFISLLLFFFISLHVYGKKVDKQTAMLVAANFLSTVATKNMHGQDTLRLVYISTSVVNGTNSQEQVYFYIFNQIAGDGFVIVAGDDKIQPILAYSNETDFQAETMPEHVRQWLTGYKNEIASSIRANPITSSAIGNKWEELKTGVRINRRLGQPASIQPLVKTKWNQSPYYNAQAPQGTPSGCVATAMAQVMKYWNYPVNGIGAHSYKHEVYGGLSADFGITSYRWTEMPEAINSSNTAIATLMFHCGVAVEMDYSPYTSNAYLLASSNEVSAERALKNYFGYSNKLHGARRDSFATAAWIALIKSELDAQRPVIYGGFGSGGGHCFITDGYKENDYFHINWGWGGGYNGYFVLNALNPEGVGTGGGTGSYNNGHQALIGVEPASDPNESSATSLVLHKEMTASQDKIRYGAQLTISANISNEGANDFSGDFCAAVFDTADAFVEYLSIKEAYELKAGDTCISDLHFTGVTSITVAPGNYYVRIFYRNSKGSWKPVRDKDNIVNKLEIEITLPDDITLNTAITIVGANHLAAGEAASVEVNLVNKGLATFSGTFQVALLDANGNLLQTIAIITTEGMKPAADNNHHYFIFKTKAITTAPGSYFLAVQFRAQGDIAWQFVAAGEFQNPVKVTVKKRAMAPDRFESNNTIKEAFPLPVIFSDHLADLHTDSSGCHIIGDDDYYKIDLPAGHHYSLNASVLDADDTTNAKKYSLDAVLTYSTDGVNWSPAFDDATSEVFLEGGVTIYFHISPYHRGDTGSYDLYISVSRSVVTGVRKPEKLQGLRLYPNPASAFVHISAAQGLLLLHSVELYNLHGQLLYKRKVNGDEQVLKIPVAHYPSGTYLIQLSAAEGKLTRKFLLRR